VIEKLLNAKLPKLAEFYDACIDTDTLDTLGLSPIEPHLKAIRSANSTVEAISRGVAISNATSVQLFARLSVSHDDADVTRNALYADHPGLPFSEEYFLEPSWARVEKPYRKYLATIFTLAGHGEVDAKAAASVVIAYERASAGVELSKRRLQAAVTPTPLPLSAANATYPLGLGLLLQEFGLAVREGCNTTTILLHVPRYFDYTEEKLRRMPVDDLKTIIEYKVLNFNAPVLSIPFAKAHSDFYDTVIYGLKELPPRAMICRGQVETSIGELLGLYYLKEVWTADNAARVDSLVLKVKAAFKTVLESTGWFDDTSRANAKTKLSKLTHLVGGPKNPKTYPTLTFDPKAYIANLNKVSAFDSAFTLAQIDTTVDKQIWEKPAQDVSGWTVETRNTIVLNGGLLQPPLFDAKADPSANYGGIGTTIGHEITHGFDKYGGNFDSDGNLNPL
ncbi:hypothetical protein DYB35_013828, partial [Aphanomyces astaci]